MDSIQGVFTAGFLKHCSHALRIFPEPEIMGSREIELTYNYCDIKSKDQIVASEVLSYKKSQIQLQPHQACADVQIWLHPYIQAGSTLRGHPRPSLVLSSHFLHPCPYPHPHLRPHHRHRPLHHRPLHHHPRLRLRHPHRHPQ